MPAPARAGTGAHHQAASAAQRRELLSAHRPGGDVGVVDHRLHRLAPSLGRNDILDRRAHPCLDRHEHLLDGAARRGDPSPDGSLDVTVRPAGATSQVSLLILLPWRA
jgi:hypothetical protein